MDLTAIKEDGGIGPGVARLVKWPGNVTVARGHERAAGRIKISNGSMRVVASAMSAIDRLQ